MRITKYIPFAETTPFSSAICREKIVEPGLPEEIHVFTCSRDKGVDSITLKKNSNEEVNITLRSFTGTVPFY